MSTLVRILTFFYIRVFYTVFIVAELVPESLRLLSMYNDNENLIFSRIIEETKEVTDLKRRRVAKDVTPPSNINTYINYTYVSNF